MERKRNSKIRYRTTDISRGLNLNAANPRHCSVLVFTTCTVVGTVRAEISCKVLAVTSVFLSKPYYFLKMSVIYRLLSSLRLATVGKNVCFQERKIVFFKK